MNTAVIYRDTAFFFSVSRFFCKLIYRFLDGWRPLTNVTIFFLSMWNKGFLWKIVYDVSHEIWPFRWRRFKRPWYVRDNGCILLTLLYLPIRQWPTLLGNNVVITKLLQSLNLRYKSNLHVWTSENSVIKYDVQTISYSALFFQKGLL